MFRVSQNVPSESLKTVPFLFHKDKRSKVSSKHYNSALQEFILQFQKALKQQDLSKETSKLLIKPWLSSLMQ